MAEVTQAAFNAYLTQNPNLKKWSDGMHIHYKDENDKIKASVFHGFFTEVYVIDRGENYATTDFVSKLIS